VFSPVVLLLQLGHVVDNPCWRSFIQHGSCF